MRGYRNMVVLRHNTTNPNNLYVYYTLPATDSNYGLTDYGYGCEYGTTVNSTTLTWESNRTINTPLILGGNFSGSSTSTIEQDQNNRGPAKGVIYWAKYWDKDLGNKNCRTYRFFGSVDPTTLSLELPCNVTYIVSVCGALEDWEHVTNKHWYGDPSSLEIEEYIERSKMFMDPLY
jgi:hypothetical protein